MGSTGEYRGCMGMQGKNGSTTRYMGVQGRDQNTLDLILFIPGGTQGVTVHCHIYPFVALFFASPHGLSILLKCHCKPRRQDALWIPFHCLTRYGIFFPYRFLNVSSPLDVYLDRFLAVPLHRSVGNFLGPSDSEYLSQAFVDEDKDLFHEGDSLFPCFRAIKAQR